MRLRIRRLVLALLAVAAVAGLAAAAVEAFVMGGGYIDTVHGVELAVNSKGTGITYLSWNCTNVKFVTRNPLRHPLKINKAAKFKGSVRAIATTYAANGTTKNATVKVKVKGFFGGVGSPANGTLRQAKCAHGKPQKFAAYPVNL